MTFTSYISGKRYNSKTNKEFSKELIDSGLTLETYCEKYLRNIAQPHHNRMLNEGESYKIKNIKLEKGTYEKVIV